MTDVRQSPQFAYFMQELGWKVEKIDNIYVYLRTFPLIGDFAKISRPQPPYNFEKFASLFQKHRIFRLKIAPHLQTSNKNYECLRRAFLKNRFRIEHFPFNPTTTIHIDLTQSEENLFKNFSEAKRRAVRRAIKNKIIIKESDNIQEFINVRKKQYFPIGFLIKKEMDTLWRNFQPKNAALLLAYPNGQKTPMIQIQAITHIGISKPIAGILLLFYDKVAYYWFASSLKAGKKLFAPTLLVWEALRLAKKRGYKIFDFEGIYDERFPKASESWRGFTKFKEGFGGKKITFLENFFL